MSLWKYFIKIFKISMLTFGGGYTIVPLIREEFVRRESLLSDDEMLSLIALSQTVPGPIAVSTALMTGYRLKGRPGAVVGVAAAALPPLITISVLYTFYAWFAENFWVRAALRGMGGAVSAVMLIAVYDLAKASLKKHRIFSAVLMVSAFLTSLLTSVNTGLIVLILGLLGIIAFKFVPEDRMP